MLGMHLAQDYLPEIHWTSSLRHLAGHSPYEIGTSKTSSFSFPDSNGTMKELLKRHGWKKISCDKSTTFHLEVNTTEEGLEAEFVLDPTQVKKVSFIILTLSFSHTG